MKMQRQNTLKNTFHIEKCILLKKCNCKIFEKEWTPWLKLFIQ